MRTLTRWWTRVSSSERAKRKIGRVVHLGSADGAADGPDRRDEAARGPRDTVAEEAAGEHGSGVTAWVEDARGLDVLACAVLGEDRARALDELLLVHAIELPDRARRVNARLRRRRD